MHHIISYMRRHLRYSKLRWSFIRSNIIWGHYRCYEENEEIAAYLLDISVMVKKFPPSFSIDEGSSTDPEKNLKCEVFTVSINLILWTPVISNPPTPGWSGDWIQMVLKTRGWGRQNCDEPGLRSGTFPSLLLLPPDLALIFSPPQKLLVSLFWLNYHFSLSDRGQWLLCSCGTASLWKEGLKCSGKKRHW